MNFMRIPRSFRRRGHARPASSCYDACVVFRAFLLPVVLGAALSPSAAFARRAGIATEGCEGCHRSGTAPKPTMMADVPRPDPGTSMTITIRLPAINGALGGFYLISNNKGAFTALAGQGTRVDSPTEVVHSTAKTAVNGEVTWQVKWTAPATKGGADFDLWAVSAAGGSRGGRSAQGLVRLNLAYGCEGVDAYIDQDGDGYGISDERGLSRVCELGKGYATKGGDCNDGNKDVNPGAPEICDAYDNNCDGKVNEGLGGVTIYRDSDGDGHGARGTADTRQGCGNTFGYAAVADDCNDDDRLVFPGAPEICGNGKDDNCNGKVDENRPYCGEGWCRRQSISCDAKACVPGAPRAEMCNAFDDDCNGVLDDAPNLCDSGKVCFQGVCLMRDQVAGAADAAALAARDMAPDRAPMSVAAGGATGTATVTGSGGAVAPSAPPGPVLGPSKPVSDASEDDTTFTPGRSGGCAVGRGGSPVSLLAGCLGFMALLVTRRRRS